MSVKRELNRFWNFWRRLFRGAGGDIENILEQIGKNPAIKDFLKKRFNEDVVSWLYGFLNKSAENVGEKAEQLHMQLISYETMMTERVKGLKKNVPTGFDQNGWNTIVDEIVEEITNASGIMRKEIVKKKNELNKAKTDLEVDIKDLQESGHKYIDSL